MTPDSPMPSKNPVGPWLRAGAVALVAIGTSAAWGEGTATGAAKATAGGAAGAELTVQQILERHAAARGGAEAWHKVQTMAWTGHIESGPGGISKHPFLLMFRRPAATRFEILGEGQRSVRVFDGSMGWKQRPTSQGTHEVKEYSAEEIGFARDAGGLDGPLFDPTAKGIGIALEGIGSVEGHRAYHLKLTLPSGQLRDDWIDAQSFLELRYDRATRNAVGATGIVSVYLRNYQTVNGLVMPLLIETGGPASSYTDRMIVDKIALNPTFENAQFTRPSVPTTRRRGVVVNTQSSPANSPA